MEGEITLDLIWWITAVEVPVLTGLFWLVWRNRRDQELALDKQRRSMDHAVAQAREALAAYKLEVAKTYASLAHLKEAERRLTSHLLRIETKLESKLLNISTKPVKE